MARSVLLASAAMAFATLAGTPLRAQDLQSRPVAPPPAEITSPAAAQGASPRAAGAQPEDTVDFNANTLEYDEQADIVTATGDVRMYRQGDRLRADKVVWNRKTGKVLATGNIAVTNPQGDVAYGDSIDLTDTLRDGVIENMLVVLEQGGRIAANHGTRDTDGVVVLHEAVYTPCAVVNATGCPKNPSWKITAVRVIYRPEKQRIYYNGARLSVFDLVTLPLPKFSSPIGGEAHNGLLSPDIRYTRANGLEAAIPYYIRFGPDRGLTITPHIFSSVAPLIQADYRQLSDVGAFRITAYGTVSPRNDDLLGADPTATQTVFRGYIDGLARYQLSPNWTLSGEIRQTTDRTFLRRYEISYDDRLRSTASLEHIDANSYLGITGWVTQTLRIGETQGQQPIALPEIDYRRRIADLLIDGSSLNLQANTLALTRTAGQDTQRAFASAQWDVRRLTNWGQLLTLTGYVRGDVYNTSDVAATSVVSYRGLSGFQGRAIAALAFDVQWPFVGSFLSGTQRLTPRFQVVASPSVRNLPIPNEDSRAVDLEDSNLFALNRFPGYDRFEDSTRFTYGADWTATLPRLTIASNLGQSYRLNTRAAIFPPGTGLDGRFSDFVGRTELRYRDFVSLTWRYRFDKADLALRRNEIDATVGSPKTYVALGYLALNRHIPLDIEDLQDRSEARVGARLQIKRFWSAFGSMIVDLTSKKDDPLKLSDGFQPVRHRLGVTYEDDCIRLGITWRRDYRTTGDARAGNGYLLTLALKNLGR